MAKNEYNKENCRQLPVSILKDQLAEFATACKTLKTTQASIINSAMLQKILEANKVTYELESSIEEK